MDPRGSGPEPNRLARFYHAGESDDLRTVVAHACDRVAVMQRGAIVETLAAEDLARGHVAHAYTRELLAASAGATAARTA